MIKPCLLLPVVLLLGMTGAAVAQSQTKTATSASRQDTPDTDAGADKNLLDAYPKTDALRSNFSSHLNYAWHRENKTLVDISRFDREDAKIDYHKWIGEQGKEHDFRLVHDWAVQAGHNSQLDKEQQSFILEAIKDMPPSNAPASVSNLMIVTYRSGMRYVTRIYDTTKLPVLVSKIEATVGKDTSAAPMLPRPTR